MAKTILLTGATDGIGLETAKMLVSAGHEVLLHGRNPNKLKDVEQALKQMGGAGKIHCYEADLSRMAEVDALAKAVAEDHAKLDALINNAGILKMANPITDDGLDVRFVVNTLAPYWLTKRLLPLLGSSGRVINLSSAAQAPVDLAALAGQRRLDDMAAYAQSKLAITMWSQHLAKAEEGKGPVIIAVNPGSLLGSKMVREGFGVAGGDLSVGATILTRAALDDDFASASGKYFDNDQGRFASPHPDALVPEKVESVVQAIEGLLAKLVH